MADDGGGDDDDEDAVTPDAVGGTADAKHDADDGRVVLALEMLIMAMASSCRPPAFLKR